MTFAAWLEAQAPERTREWTLSDVRAAFEAGRLAGLAEAARLCERRARTHELNSKCLDRKAQLVLVTHIEECHATARDIRALASAPQGEKESRG